MPVANLEIFLYRRDTGSDSTSYGIELRFADPQSEADKRQGGLKPVRFDPEELRAKALDPAAYGQYLAAQLLTEPRCKPSSARPSPPHRLRTPRCTSAWRSARMPPISTTCGGRRCACPGRPRPC